MMQALQESIEDTNNTETTNSNCAKTVPRAMQPLLSFVTFRWRLRRLLLLLLLPFSYLREVHRPSTDPLSIRFNAI